MHEVKIRWKGQVYDTMFPIVESAYHARGGKRARLPGLALVSGEGRADTHVATDASGELYVLTKSDGVIRVASRPR